MLRRPRKLQGLRTDYTRLANVYFQPHRQYLLLSMGQSTARISQGAINGDSESQWRRYAQFSCYAYRLMSNMDNSRRTPSIHVLDDDSLLHVFNFCRPFVRNEDGPASWRYNGRWWYALSHVRRRWRNIVLGSATYLGLSLLCTYGTPIADMLAHSPPFHSSLVTLGKIVSSPRQTKKE